MVYRFNSLVSSESLDDARAKRVRVTWKFVVITQGDQTAVVAGPVARFPYHANLVANYCDHNAIPSTWIKKPDYVEILDYQVKLRGGGYLLIDCGKQKIKVYGRSTAYGPFSVRDLTTVTKIDPFFSGYQVEVVGG